jgi:hypothetical protein
MHSGDRSDPFCFVRRAAHFNAAALKSGRRLHHSAIFPGHIRFNSKSGFNPEFRLRAIGMTFYSPGPKQIDGRVHLLLEREAGKTDPDTFLVTLNSAQHGSIRFKEAGWRSSGVLPISISLRRERYEAMLLVGPEDWVRSELGLWHIDPAGTRLMLMDCDEEIST